MKKVIRVSKEKDIYNFIIDDLGNLIYKVTGKDESQLIHRELISSKAEEISIFVEDRNSIYLLFKEEEDLKCAILRDKNINIGTLYSYVKGNYKINHARMFIENNNINILAVLRNDDVNVRDVIIHYIYVNEDVKENTVKILNKNEEFKSYLCSVNKDNIKIFYTDRLPNNKDGIFYSGYSKIIWQEEKKIIDIWGSIYDFDVKEIENKLYIAAMYSNYSINILKVSVFDENLNLEKEKVYYSLQKISDINFIDQSGDLFITWMENDKIIISSSLINDKYIKTYKIPKNDLIICENYKVENFFVRKSRQLVSYKEKESISFLNIEELFKELVEEEKDIVSYNRDTLEILAVQREEKEKIMKEMQSKIQGLKKDISVKEAKVIEMQSNYGDNKIRELREEYEKSILNLVRKNNLKDKDVTEFKDKVKFMENNIVKLNEEKEINMSFTNELQKKFEKSLMDIEHINNESHKVLEEEKCKYENEVKTYEEIIKSYEETIRMNSEVIDKKDEIIRSYEEVIQEKDEIIMRLMEKAKEEDEKGIIRRLFKK